ncbi:hypothetical protein PWE35_09225 [Stenotrophomonas maltophilia]|uniref:hypothetical protein n=1 Tax=Stenotrophomonas maltophilia TaxID=40324 RepID=UPI00237FCADD|nr:hypothetical protein [Stenotrophomonas maltophilia]WDW06004.1 hypothetical protein PWE35_09225 [Stenotrophomonas maltophilia]
MKSLRSTVLFAGLLASTSALGESSDWKIDTNGDEVVAYTTDMAGNMFGLKCGAADSVCYWAIRPLNGCGDEADITVTVVTDGYPTPVQARCIPSSDGGDPFVVFLDMEQLSSVVQSSKSLSFSAPTRFATGPIDVTGAGPAVLATANKLKQK